MRLIYVSLLLPISLLIGCQTLGDHFNCTAEVDRTVPAQTQQKYVRTDTKCVKSNEQSLGGGMGTIYNPGQGDINCSAVPIYETIVLNQAQRDAAYQQCRGRVNSQKQVQQTARQTYSGDKDLKVHPYTLFDAQQQCGAANPRGTEAFQNCVNVLTKGNSAPQPPQTNQKPTSINQPTTGLEAAKKKCIELGFKVGTESFGQCVLRVAK